MSSPGQVRPAVAFETAGPPAMSSPGQVRPAVTVETAGPPAMSSPGQVRPAVTVETAGPPENKIGRAQSPANSSVLIVKLDAACVDDKLHSVRPIVGRGTSMEQTE